MELQRSFHGHSGAWESFIGGAALFRMVGVQGGVDGDASSNRVVSDILRRKSGGRALPMVVRQRMERAFGHGFEHVRIHTDGRAQMATAALHAKAMALGSDLFFGSGEFAPGTPAGDRLLAHELTHVVQHDDHRLPTNGGVSSPSDPHEVEAYANEGAIVSRLDTVQAVEPAAPDRRDGTHVGRSEDKKAPLSNKQVRSAVRYNRRRYGRRERQWGAIAGALAAVGETPSHRSGVAPTAAMSGARNARSGKMKRQGAGNPALKRSGAGFTRTLLGISGQSPDADAALAVARFQQATGLTVDGKVGSRTRRSLLKSRPASSEGEKRATQVEEPTAPSSDEQPDGSVDSKPETRSAGGGEEGSTGAGNVAAIGHSEPAKGASESGTSLKGFKAFKALVVEGGGSVKNAEKVFEKAKRKCSAAWATSFYETVSAALASENIAVRGSTSSASPAFLAAVYLFQSRTKGVRANGVPNETTLKSLARGLQDDSLRTRMEGYLKDVPGRKRQTGQESKKWEAYRKTLISTPVLGVGFAYGKGVNPTMHGKLTKAHNALKVRLRAAIGEQAANGQQLRSRIDGSPITAADNKGLKHFIGIRQKHLGWSSGHAKQSYHKTGSAVDINYHSNPWTAVRTDKRTGGEGGRKFGINKNAVMAIDRAMAFMSAGSADIHAELRPDNLSEDERRKWAGDQWERFNKVSQTVSDYMALAYDREAARTQLVEHGVKKVLLRWRGSRLFNSRRAAARLLDSEVSETKIQQLIEEKHGGTWSMSAKQMRKQIVEDMHLVARSMVVGKQKSKPNVTRNPLIGTFDLKKELVQELVAAGLRWGACELGRNSGDMMHFDLGDTPTLKHERRQKAEWKRAARAKR